MTITDFNEYVKQVKEKDPSLFLGELVWYTVSESRVQYNDLKKRLEEAGLKDFIPKHPRDEDVFRRIAPNGHKQKVGTYDPNKYVNYRIHPVKRGDGICVKHIVAEEVDSAGERLSFLPVYEMKYVKGSGNGDLSIASLCDPADPVAASIASNVLSDYTANQGWVGPQNIRILIHKILEHCKATTVRPTGGVYFVMGAYTDTIRSLEDFISGIHQSQVHALPLVSDEKQRDMVKRAYEAESVGQVEDLMDEAVKILASDTRITAKRYGSLSRLYSEAKAKTEEYEDLLSTTLEETNTKLKVLKMQMTKLLSQVKS